jgi:HEAT repeat protein
VSDFLAGDPLVGLWLGRLLLILAATIVVSVTFLLLHHAGGLRREAGRRRRIEAAAEELAPYLAGGSGAAAAVAAAVRSWGRFAVSTVLRRARRSLSGESERAVSALLEEMGETRRLARTARRGGALRRARALRRLASCGGERARRELLRATADRQPVVRRVAREGLLELRDLFSVRAAMAAFVGESGQPRSWSRAFFLRLAVYAPAELRHLTGARGLTPALEKLALEALAETGDAAAAPLALVGIRSPEAEMRAAGVRLLGAIGDRQWTPLLTGLLHDPEWFVRAAAARALGGMGCNHENLEALGASLTDSHWWVRANAARSLAQLGPLGMHRLARAATTGHGFAREAAMPELLRLADAPPAPPHDDAATRDLSPAVDDGATRDLAVAS